MTTEDVTVKSEGMTVSRMIWRRYRRRMPGLAEQVFAINPGLAAVSPILPVGTTFKMPVVSDQPQTVKVIRLWG
ncbi:phage tail protein X [Rhodopseudomonas faecalis]|uniref:Phage tail protein X n=1 Tax=Rhodopseudomonas faecalis TaxID=99655 RepID=A0A318TMG0_9BRAD|nr:tail protein X [Rhodopseudomonas faecalis]PYF05050.1 phage tail protein X [Rhodopseudomonas faecalis]